MRQRVHIYCWNTPCDRFALNVGKLRCPPFVRLKMIIVCVSPRTDARVLQHGDHLIEIAQTLMDLRQVIRSVSMTADVPLPKCNGTPR